MNNFWLYFQLGWQHIADINGIDHILFIAALCLGYQFMHWKKLLLLVTAFTVGHSITLALSVLNIMKASTAWIEFMIPITILITALLNVRKRQQAEQKMTPVYLLTLFFGLIHGLGFSNYLKSLLGKEENIVTELLAFNLGLEAGQVLILACILLVSFIFVTFFKTPRYTFVLFVSGGIAALALQMALERHPF